MKTGVKNFLLSALTIGFCLELPSPVAAQVFTTLHNFTEQFINSSVNAWTNNDGAYPQSRLVLSGQILFGMSEFGGNEGSGSIFAINTDGTGFTNLYSFTENAYPYPINNDGANPVSELALSGDALYGTASQGGNANLQPYGTIFAINTNGTGFVNLHNFTGDDGGANPAAGLILSGSILFGTTANGGSSGDGILFAINMDGTGFTNLHSFNWDNDGAHPVARLVLSGNTLYGTTQDGGTGGYGIVFRVNTNGTDFTTLHNFTADDDGANPEAGLILSSNILYGTTSNYGSLGGYGAIFAIHTDGTGFTNLHSFTANRAFIDGAFPYSELVLSDHTLYGTTHSGGISDNGTVFTINTDGSGFTNLYNFKESVLPYNPNIDGGIATNSDGAGPFAGLILTKNALYGTASYGGGSGTGTIFKLALGAGDGPQLTIVVSGTNVVLTWPASASGFSLQSAPNISGPFANIIGATNPYTNTMSGMQMFFRLSQ